jgi:hypothetical protein
MHHACGMQQQRAANGTPSQSHDPGWGSDDSDSEQPYLSLDAAYLNAARHTLSGAHRMQPEGDCDTAATGSRQLMRHRSVIKPQLLIRVTNSLCTAG